jgi:D-ornithine 4,5-aminomutase subunit beta
VCSHFGNNRYPLKACSAYGGCTLCDPSKIVYIDELDETDNVHNRLKKPLAEKAAGMVRPEVEWAGDGIVCFTLFVPEEPRVAEAAALEMARKMGLTEPEVISRRLIHPAEGSLFEVKGVLDYAVDKSKLVLQEEEEILPDSEIEVFVRPRKIHVVAATVGEDEHSVGMREIIDIKHGGLEKYAFHCHYLGTSVPVSKVLDAAQETGAKAALISTIISHNDIHRLNMRRLHDLAVERGIRDGLILISGGTQVNDAMAVECGMDAGFGRGTKGKHVASFIVGKMMGKKNRQAG